MTLIIGITGGIGSGKSTLSNYLKKKKFFVHDSDTVVKEIYTKPTKKFQDYLIKIDLKEALKNKKINKKVIAKKIFSNELIKRKLENFIHKKVQKHRNNFIKYHKKKKTKVVFIDIPLLFENNLDNLFNKILCVLSHKKTRLKRIVSSRKIKIDIFRKITRNQVTDVERKKRSNYFINNNKTKKFFFKKADEFIRLLVL